jgi:membrane protein YdbS with pleckstrin-like domain
MTRNELRRRLWLLLIIAMWITLGLRLVYRDPQWSFVLLMTVLAIALAKNLFVISRKRVG